MRDSERQLMKYREAIMSDIPALARVRAAEWETEEYWSRRIAGYLNGTVNPQHALAPRVVYVVLDRTTIIGFIAGHLSRRFGCEGELEWINVVPFYRGTGIAAALLRLLAAWFQRQNALRVCVDPDEQARKFYVRHGAIPLNKHWMVWPDMTKLATDAPPILQEKKAAQDRHPSQNSRRRR